MFRRSNRKKRYRVAIRPGGNWRVVKFTVKSTTTRGAKRAAIRTAQTNNIFGSASKELNESHCQVTEE